MISRDKLIAILVSLLMVSTGTHALHAQQTSGREYRRTGIHNGNLVRTVFGNWGVVGQPADEGPRGAWINDNNGYIGDVSPLVGAEVSTIDTSGTPVSIHSVIVTPADRPNQGGFEESPTGKFWGFEPVSGYLNETQERIAMSTNPGTWPPYWPDKTDDPDDPGWSGSWNGYFGKDVQNIQQESYFVMNDNNDEEFNYEQYNEWNVAFKPDSTNPAKNGLGLQMSVRGMQWQQFLAQDCIFWLYEVTNTSTTDYKKAVFGMLVGTYVGVTSTEDRGEYDDDWSFFDVNDDITYTGDFDNDVSRNPKWVGEVGMVGYAFLESPGNPFDGIDNDGDYNSIEGAPFAPLFEETDFDSFTVNVGDVVMLIDANYDRSTLTIPDSDTVIVTTLGTALTLIPGETRLAEGNPIMVTETREGVNPNAFDGIDNDLDGLIDENYFLHYRQRRVDQNGVILFDIVNPRAHINYIDGIGTSNPLIDEARDDGVDNDGDWDPEFDDVGIDGIPDTQDLGEGDGVPTIGEPNFDEKDVDESDQIGLTSFDYFTPAGDYPMKYDEQLWEKLRPGFFDTPSSIQDGEPIAGEDGDFIYGSGFFPLRSGKTERFSVALVYGKDLEELINNKRTVQNIYNNNYRFPPPPLKPSLTVVPGDGKVTLYWDRVAENSVDPITKIADFQGYKIYRATDYNFNDVRNITNAHGIIEGYTPIAQFDLDDDIEGYFYPSNMLYQETQGYGYYLGDNSGLVHKFVDDDVQNGRTYYYALVAYDRGESDQDIFPAENSKFISVLNNGEIITDKNTARVTPTSTAAGYALNDTITVNHDEGIATGTLQVNVVDPTRLSGHRYKVSFVDQSNDEVDNDGDWDPQTDDVGTDGQPSTNDPDGSELNGEPDSGEPNVDSDDNDEIVPITTYYTIRDMEKISFTFTANDTLVIDLPYKNIIPGTYELIDQDGNTVTSDRYILDTNYGRIRGAQPGDLGEIEYTITFEYYPVLRSPYIQNTIWTKPGKEPYTPETEDTEVFDGIQLNFDNNWSIGVVDSLSYWWTTEDDGNTWQKNLGDRTYIYSFSNTNLFNNSYKSLRMPNDYMVVFGDTVGFGQSLDIMQFILSQGSTLTYGTGGYTNFKIIDRTHNREVPFVFYDEAVISSDPTNREGMIDPQDIIYFMEQDTSGSHRFTWTLTFALRQSHPDTLQLEFGDRDTLFISITKPFRKGDIFSFKTTRPSVKPEFIKQGMDEIRVVPNPYFAAHKFEEPLPAGITSGRGERKIYFQHVPNDSRIHIYTSRGQHVITLETSSNIHDGTVTWNLKSKENLDVAYGVYFYVVESDVGGKHSGKFAVIK